MRPAVATSSPPRGETRAAARRNVFLYQDGVVLAATLRGLEELGLASAAPDGERSVADLCAELPASGFGYLRAGLRGLTSQGWLADAPTLDPSTTMLRWTASGRCALGHRDRYIALADYLAHFAGSDARVWERPWDERQAQAFLALLDPACDRWGLEADIPADLAALMTAHLDGAFAVPALLALNARGALAGERPDLGSDDVGRGMDRLLAALGWTGADGRWTPAGREGRQFALHFGLIGSYLPMLARLGDLYRGSLTVVAGQDRAAPEWHVQRELNIVASGAAHRRYFADADGIFTELFDREPVTDQPRFLADMGCGDGSWLIHLYELVRDRTLRGRLLDEHPLTMVGIDWNAAALDHARAALKRANVPALLIVGDVSQPDSVARTLREHGLEMSGGLHVRAFLDHNRTYIGGDPDAHAPEWSSGAYVDAEGRPLSAAAVERDLIAHLSRWTPHVQRHGLVVLEAHCVAPAVAQRHLGALHSVTFDTYHGYSHQYPVDHQAFVRCCQEAGLQPVGHSERRYPSSRPFVAVSLDRLLPADAASALPSIDASAERHDTWRPDPDTERDDGRGLHELLFAGGDLRHPRMWCSAATGHVVEGALGAVERRLRDASAGDTIRVLDYGTGTGFAAIELLKACDERGLPRRLRDRGVELELHLADLPSSWFAFGYDLLHVCSWTRFHSLRAPDGAFRPLLEVTGGAVMDAVMANMVFHLIPPAAIRRLAGELATVVAPDGRLVWSSPDLGPPGPHAVLFHDANRELRRRWVELLQSGAGPGASRAIHAAVAAARETGDGASRADRRILPQPHLAEDVAAALRERFDGQLERPTYEMLAEEVLAALLVPSNQAEFLPEIADPELREQVVRELMVQDVLPKLRNGAGATALGINVQWTLGDFVRA